jgi:soluble lytic murein transglycosylase-like protein
VNPAPELVALARKTAVGLKLDEALVCAIVEQESAWDTWSIRYEPGFRSRYVAPLGLPPTAEISRSISWGLMQLMGESARELGFAGPLPQLCDPPTGLYWGCRWFAAKMAAAAGDETKALLLWNGGANAGYPGQVLARVRNYGAAQVDG